MLSRIVPGGRVRFGALVDLLDHRRRYGEPSWLNAKSGCVVMLPHVDGLATGGVTRFAADVPRWNEHGLVVHPARTNLHGHSENHSAANYSGGAIYTITADAIEAPDGNATADRWLETAVNNQWYEGLSVAGAAAQPIVYSVFVLPIDVAARPDYEHRYNLLGSGNQRAFFNCLTGVCSKPVGIAPTRQSVTALPGGWYLYEEQVTYGAGDAAAVTHYLAEKSFATFVGDVAKGHSFWGNSQQVGTLTWPMIPTAGAGAASSVAPVYYIHREDFLYYARRAGLRMRMRFRLPVVPADGTEYPLFAIYQGANDYAGLFWCPSGGGDLWKWRELRGGVAAVTNGTAYWTPAIDQDYELWISVGVDAGGGRAQHRIRIRNHTTGALDEDATINVEYLPLAATRLYLGCSGAETGQWDVFVREFGT